MDQAKAPRRPRGQAARWRDHLRARLHAWGDARAPRQDIQRWDHANLYVLPTRAGWLCALTLLAMLVGAINFQLQLGHALVFLIGSVAAVSVWQTHATLRGLRLEVLAAPDAAAGATAALQLRLCNDGPARHGLRLGWRDAQAMAGADAEPGAPAPAALDLELAAGEQRTLTLHHAAGPRGRQRPPVLEIATTYPYGLFRSWGWMRPAGTRIVHPAPERPVPPWPRRPQSAADGPTRAATTPGDGQDDPDMPRPWRRGDRPRELLWKHYARSERLLVRERLRPAPPPVETLTLEDALGAMPATAGPALEAALSRLCAWILQAAHDGRPLRLQLPGRPPITVDAAGGTTALAVALQALALHGLPQEAAAPPPDRR